MSIKSYLDSLGIIQDFIPPNPNTRQGIRIVPTHITIHNTDNDRPGANAVAHNRYIRGADAMRVRKVSWHFTVDDDAIFYHVPVNEKAIHAGPANMRSVAIEICMNRGLDEDTAYRKAASLTAYLCRELKVPPQNIVQHHFWTQKNCPKILRNPAGRWSWFLGQVKAELDLLADLPMNYTEMELDDSSGVPMSYSTRRPPEPAEEDLAEILQGIDKSFASHDDPDTEE